MGFGNWTEKLGGIRQSLSPHEQRRRPSYSPALMIATGRRSGAPAGPSEGEKRLTLDRRYRQLGSSATMVLRRRCGGDRRPLEILQIPSLAVGTSVVGSWLLWRREFGASSGAALSGSPRDAEMEHVLAPWSCCCI
ncbi:hypothetical protein MPTK1_4g15920 [Marchantia polymorpha subsp. ruderalis]|uniref:Uncharacterized protein n=2 Tax=Marchantia polymorpha TaxID=3197 RepID=A0AAF6BAC5_MARPO|nr:hypothetical protein MARPO_0054s0057 [Marchantia polymorpha]BBN08959.1 hypothetical protein Mp_4g15920 [Marchantia polymorpha subsp. ruderalis]|eukprot:PTQ37945.1 hypothetical protein MARPO_0054s0057 [Marchantia polymorpha]